MEILAEFSLEEVRTFKDVPKGPSEEKIFGEIYDQMITEEINGTSADIYFAEQAGESIEEFEKLIVSLKEERRSFQKKC